MLGDHAEIGTIVISSKEKNVNYNLFLGKDSEIAGKNISRKLRKIRQNLVQLQQKIIFEVSKVSR